MKKSIGLVAAIAAMFFIGSFTLSQAEERIGVTDTEILIGGIAPMTGPASNLGPEIELAGKLVAKQVNEAGGIYGRKIRYIVADDVCGSSQGLAATKKLVFNDKVFAMHGLACSHVGMAIRPVLEKEEVPLIITVAQGPNLLNPFSRYIFRVFPPTSITGNLMAIFMRQYFPQKYTRVALLHTQEEYGSSGRDGLVGRLEKFGIKPLAIETHKIGDTDFSSQLLKIKGLNPEVLFILSYVKDMALIAKQAHELGLNVVKIGYVGGNYAILRELAGKEALTDFYASTVLTDTFRSDRLKSFMDLYKKEYPEYMKNPYNPSDSNVTAYVAMQLYAEAIKRAGKDLTRTKFIQALEGIKNYDSSWLPPISFSPSQHEGITAKRYVRFVDGVPNIIPMDIKMD